MTNNTSSLRHALLAASISLLAACGGDGGGDGGGGGGGGDPDTTPDAFGFAGFDNVLPGFAYTSDEITVKGISDNVDLTLTVTGEGCEYSIDGGEFGNGETEVRNGQKVVLRLETPAEYDTEQSCTLDINGISADFTLKTGKNTFAMEAVPGHLEFSWSEFTGAESYRIQRSNHETGETEIVAEDIAGGADSYRLPVSVLFTDWVNDRYQLIVCSGECNALPGHEGELVQAMSVAASGYLKASHATRFGAAVALHENLLAVSAAGDPGHFTHLFELNEDSVQWVPVLNSDIADSPDLALGDGQLIVGSANDPTNPDPEGDFITGSGTVFVYEPKDGEWQETSLLKASNMSERAYFGRSVALDGNTLVVGADGESSNPDPEGGPLATSGAAYVFERDEAGEWREVAILKASNASADARFGYDVAVNGDTILVGASTESSNTDTEGEPLVHSGAVYVFERDENGEWQEVAFLKASNADSYAYFGYSVALRKDTLVVGAIDESSNPDPEGEPLFESGAAYVFERDDNGEWQETTMLKANNADEGDAFGYDVALEGDLVAVSARYEDGSGIGLYGDAADNTAEDSGAVYLFKRSDDGSWQQHRYIKATNTGSQDYFGKSIALDGGRLAVGASGASGGAVYIY